AQPVPALARRDAPGGPYGPAALPVPSRDLSPGSFTGADRGAAAHGGAPARRRPRAVRAFLRRQLPRRLRPAPRADRPADHPRGAGPDPPGPPPEPERTLQRRRSHRPRVDLLPDGQDVHAPARVAPEMAPVPEAAPLGRLHGRQHGLRPARLL